MLRRFGLRGVSAIGRGSSFDGAGATMNVLRRAEQLRSEERALLDATLADAELGDLARACAAVRGQLAARYAEASSQA